MEYEVTYQGHKIRITITPAAATSGTAGEWRSMAEVLDSPGWRSELEVRGSEEEARRAALSAAIEQIDRARTRTGKR